MDKYYFDGQKSVGPISEEDFTKLVNQGTITNETLIWSSGMPNWIKYGEIPKTKKSKLVWWIVGFIILSIIGTIIVNMGNFEVNPTQNQLITPAESNPNNPPASNNQGIGSSVGIVSSIKCDGSENILTIPVGYGIMRLETPVAKKQEVLNLKSDPLIKELIQINSEPITGNKMFNETFKNLADVNDQTSGSSLIAEGSDEFFIGINLEDNEKIFVLIQSKGWMDYGLSSVYGNGLENPLNISYTCIIV